MKNSKPKNKIQLKKLIIPILVIINLLFTSYLTYRLYKLDDIDQRNYLMTVKRLYNLERSTGTPSPTAEEFEKAATNKLYVCPVYSQDNHDESKNKPCNTPSNFFTRY